MLLLPVYCSCVPLPFSSVLSPTSNLLCTPGLAELAPAASQEEHPVSSRGTERETNKCHSY